MALAARAGREAAEEQLGRDVPFSLLLVVYYSDHRQREVAKERQGCGGTRLKTVLKRVREELVQPIFQQRPRAGPLVAFTVDLRHETQDRRHQGLEVALVLGMTQAAACVEINQ